MAKRKRRAFTPAYKAEVVDVGGHARRGPRRFRADDAAADREGARAAHPRRRVSVTMTHCRTIADTDASRWRASLRSASCSSRLIHAEIEEPGSSRRGRPRDLGGSAGA
jgi:hypothetical protein